MPQSADQGIGFYVDDVFVGAPRAFNIDLFDLQRVEVIHGPQGTLFGRNVLGGAIQMVSVEPEKDLAATIDAEYGNYNFRKVRAMANIPLIQDLLLSRFTFTSTDRDGTVKNLFDGRHINTLGNFGGRAQFLLFPRDAFEVKVNGDYVRDESHRSAFGPFDDILSQQVNIFDPAQEMRKVYGVSARVAFKQPNFTLLSISGFRGMNAVSDTSDFVPVHNLHFAYDSQQHQISQEIRLLSPASQHLRWVSGLFYYREWTKDLFSYILPVSMLEAGLPAGFQETSYATAANDSYSVFADVTYALRENLDLTTGVRFSYDERSLHYRHANTLGGPGVFALAQQAKKRAFFDN